ncbi:helix-turn-helix domain-containing protein [Nocardia arizonensis]|uniref:helix-turn-helix domain-containing protein n=1 Tax=Nocardia arizonensis TaxID=1141647 RepID=UPI003530D1FD
MRPQRHTGNRTAAGANPQVQIPPTTCPDPVIEKRKPAGRRPAGFRLVDLAGTYSKQCGLLDRFADLWKQVEADSPRQAKQSPAPRSSGGPKKHLAADEAATIVAEYEAGASMAQLKREHHMAKRTVAKVLREAGVTIRPRGGQYR